MSKQQGFWKGLTAQIYATSAGVFDAPAMPDHLLILHHGPPVKATCRCDGRAQSRLQTKGDMTIVPAGLPARWEDDRNSAILALSLPATLLSSAAASMGLGDTDHGLAPQLQVRDPQIEHTAYAIQAELESPVPDVFFMEGLTGALATRLLRRFPAAPLSYRDGLSRQQRQRVLDYIEENIDQVLSLSELAGVARLSVSHFKALFRRSLNCSVHAYVIRRRVERARALIREERMPLSEVALSTGFAHQSHMARWMRRELGITPMGLKRALA